MTEEAVGNDESEDESVVDENGEGDTGVNGDGEEDIEISESDSDDDGVEDKDDGNVVEGGESGYTEVKVRGVDVPYVEDVDGNKEEISEGDLRKENTSMELDAGQLSSVLLAAI